MQLHRQSQAEYPAPQPPEAVPCVSATRELIETLRDAARLIHNAGRAELAEQLSTWAEQLNQALAQREARNPSLAELWLG